MSKIPPDKADSSLVQRKRRSLRSASPPPASSSNNLTDEERNNIQHAVTNNYRSIPIEESKEDAAYFNPTQLHWIKTNQKRRFQGMSFIHQTDDNICDVFEIKPTTKIPFISRKSTRDIYEFRTFINSKRKNAIQQIESRSTLEIHHRITNNTSTYSTDCFPSNGLCMGLSRDYISYSAGIAGQDEPTMDEFESYKESLLYGYDFLCQMAVRNVADEINKRGRHDLIRHRGFIKNETNDNKDGPLMILKANMSRSDADEETCNLFSFHDSQCEQRLGSDCGLMCIHCERSAHYFRKRCIRKAKIQMTTPTSGKTTNY